MSVKSVRKTLVRSSLNLKSINKTVATFSDGMVEANKIASAIVKQTRGDNKLIRNIIAKEESFFLSRRESVLRKEKEGLIEASKLGGAVKYGGSVTQDSTKGFLGRMLDFTAILMSGWFLTNSKGIIKGGDQVTKQMSEVTNTSKNALDSTLESFTRFGEDLATFDTQLKNLQGEEQESEMAKEFDSVAENYNKLGSGLFNAMNLLYDDKATGLDFFDGYFEKLKGTDKSESTSQDNEIEKLKQEDTPLVQKSEPVEDAKPPNLNDDPVEELVKKVNENKQKVQKESNKQEKAKEKEVVKEIKEEDDEDEFFNSKVANDVSKPLSKRFENGYIPDREIFFKDKKGKQRSKLNPEWVQYQEWLNSSGFDMFADGGRPVVGKTSIVGEKGPELFVADTPGQIISNEKLNTDSFFQKTITTKGTSKDEIRMRRRDRSRYEKAVEELKEKQNGIIYYDQDEALKEQYIFGPRNARKNNTSSPPPKEIKPIIDGVESDQSITVQKKPSVSETIKKERRGPIVMLPPRQAQQSQSSPQLPSTRTIQMPLKTNNVNIIKIIQDLELSYT